MCIQTALMQPATFASSGGRRRGSGAAEKISRDGPEGERAASFSQLSVAASGCASYGPFDPAINPDAGKAPPVGMVPEKIVFLCHAMIWRPTSFLMNSEIRYCWSGAMSHLHALQAAFRLLQHTSFGFSLARRFFGIVNWAEEGGEVLPKEATPSQTLVLV
jgi:hypothetical protein